ncbi:RNA-binding protein 33-like [Uloborus diversus]|uniref:RNA-binding protein 33-like n=1 Tax=Uloborus diversus TaxID=327109 RepID=UPI002409608A|nr:RNA-binding protein 33-like [Uloborus diversus]
MKLAWMFCLLLAGKLSAASPGEERAAAEANLGSGYMMAFPMNDDQVAEESAQEAVKMLAESLVSDDDDDDDDESAADQEEKKIEESLNVEEKKEDQTEQPEPMNILQDELTAEEEAEKPALPQRPFFKRPKIEELRKILGFPPPEGPAKSKPIPQEKPKMFQGIFNKPNPKPKIEQSPLGGLQFNLRREDRMRPFGFPILPMKRDDSFRPFGIPDLVQAASSILRRAIVDDNNENDISKDDKEEEDSINENEQPEENEEEEDDEDSLMIVPIPDPKEVTIERPPLFKRLPIPFPFPVPKPMPQNRPRLPFPPLTPVAFFLPIAQQIMQNIRHSQPRSQPPMMPMQQMHPVQPQIQNFLPIQTQIPIIPIHHPMQQQQHMLPVHQPMMPMPQPVQQIVPFFPVPQAAFHVPVLTPLPSNMQRSIMRQMPRRMPVHAQPPQQLPRRAPFPNPMSRMAAPQPHYAVQPQLMNPMMRRPMQQAANTRPMPRVVRPPMPPVHPIFFMMPVPNMHVPFAQQQQQVPIYHRPQQLPFIPQPVPVMPQQRQMMQQMSMPEEERVIFVRPDQDEQDDDQEVLILVPSDEVEVTQRPPVLPPHLMRQVPTPVVNPLQRIKFLRDLLLARQANRQVMSPQNRASRVVEIVQQQLRIFPAHHQQAYPAQPQRADSSELHPVYVPFPGPQ